ncbi:MAG: 3-oxoacyl-[acyl-carrier-protein] synthase III C-terminal domain-containing protein [Candidatus Nanopelagicales bacterium]
MSVVAGVGRTLGGHEHTQEEITDAFASVVVADDVVAERLLRRVHANAGVRTRSLVLPLAAYADLDGFTAANTLWIEAAVDLGGRAVLGALAQAGLDPADVDVLMTTTVTGVAAPSLDARLVEPLGLRHDVKRVPLFGLGCVAGAAGIARLHDHLVGHPDDVVVLLAVELCSLTLQRDDTSTAHLVASGLFGDGAAAVVLVGERRAADLGLRGPRVLASRSRFYPATGRVMGWDVGSSGLRIVLSAGVAEVVTAHLGEDMKGFLDAHDLDVADVRHWVAHPGGPKVIDAVVASLGLDDDALAPTRRSLASIGNLSSASVLHVLADVLDEHPAGTGEPAVLLAMGPGFCSELVLLEW